MYRPQWRSPVFGIDPSYRCCMKLRCINTDIDNDVGRLRRQWLNWIKQLAYSQHPLRYVWVMSWECRKTDHQRSFQLEPRREAEMLTATHNLEGHSDARWLASGHWMGRHVGQGRQRRGMAELDCIMCSARGGLRCKVRSWRLNRFRTAQLHSQKRWRLSDWPVSVWRNRNVSQIEWLLSPTKLDHGLLQQHSAVHCSGQTKIW